MIVELFFLPGISAHFHYPFQYLDLIATFSVPSLFLQPFKTVLCLQTTRVPPRRSLSVLSTPDFFTHSTEKRSASFFHFLKKD